jgi:hypothetical protein
MLIIDKNALASISFLTQIRRKSTNGATGSGKGGLGAQLFQSDIAPVLRREIPSRPFPTAMV